MFTRRFLAAGLVSVFFILSLSVESKNNDYEKEMSRFNFEEALVQYREGEEDTLEKMKKYVVIGLSLCMILGSLGLTQPAAAQETQKSDTEAFLKYQVEMKSPWVGVGAAFLVPSLGHAYAGDWGRGIKFLLADAGSLAVMFIGASQAVQSGSSALFTIGYLGLIVFRAWEYVDAYKTVEDYNEKLAKKYGIKFSLNLKQDDNGENSIRLALSYKF